MIVEETTESPVIITSDRKLTYAQLERRAEKVRLAGGTVHNAAVKDVKIWCESARINGYTDDRAVAR